MKVVFHTRHEAHATLYIIDASLDMTGFMSRLSLGKNTCFLGKNTSFLGIIKLATWNLFMFSAIPLTLFIKISLIWKLRRLTVRLAFQEFNKIMILFSFKKKETFFLKVLSWDRNLFQANISISEYVLYWKIQNGDLFQEKNYLSWENQFFFWIMFTPVLWNLF